MQLVFAFSNNLTKIIRGNKLHFRFRLQPNIRFAWIYGLYLPKLSTTTIYDILVV